jgi:hypothetical protein
MSCASGTCVTVNDTRYGHCLKVGEYRGRFLEMDHLLRLHCSKDFHRKEGGLCSGNKDCVPSTAGPNYTLTCSSGTCRKVPRTAPPADYRKSCGLTRADLKSWLDRDEAVPGKTCGLCHIYYDFKQDCLKQGCTVTCKYDDDCPAGSACLCVPYNGKVLLQVCTPVSRRETHQDRTADLTCR